MSALFHRTCDAALPWAESGDGCYIIDRQGKRYLDASGGAAISCLGHSDETVKTAIRQQLERLPFAHTSFFTTEAAETFAEMLISRAPKGLNRVYPVSGGSEAIEAALKLARQYFLERGEPGRTRIIARRQSYHGATLGALAAGENAWRREAFAPLMIETGHISPCFEYRGRAEGETSQAYGLRMADELEHELQRVGPETVIAFIAEPVVGASLGAVPAVPGYFRRIREICDRYGVLLILDEVMCGMGRTGTLFAFEQEGIVPDIVTIAKGLGAGYQPVGAMLCSARLHDTIAAGSGFFQHGHSYLGHPMAMAAATAVLGRLTDGEMLRHVDRMGEILRARLQDAFGQHPNIGDIRGRGLFIGVELVDDRETKTPFDPAIGLHRRVKAAAMDAGLMCYPMGGTVYGRRGDHILLAPPFILNADQTGELVDKLSQAIGAALP
jgi:adenosylmethionine-8-amino-7-oxononanoate aminotransferase